MSNGDLERRVIELEEYIARIPARWASIAEPKKFGWAQLSEELLNAGTADATPEGSDATIEIVDKRALIGSGKKLSNGSWVFYAENAAGELVLIQSHCPVDA